MTALPLSGRARNAYPGDQVYISLHPINTDDGQSYPAGTEYVPLSAGVDNAKRGTPMVQRVMVGGRRVSITGRKTTR